MKLKCFAFDLDGTLCSLTDGEYHEAVPFPRRIAHVNSLHDAGHRVIIFTARGATSKRDVREFTLEQLNSWGVRFDDLYMGKPHFDILVDDKAISDVSYFRSVTGDD